MSAPTPFQADRPQAGAAPSEPGGLLDVLRVAAVVLDADGRIVLWSPQAEELFGYTAEEALGQHAGRLLVHEQHLEHIMELFSQVTGGDGSWAGVFPVRHKDGSTRLVEFRNMRLEDDQKDIYVLGLASDQATLRQVEQDLALSTRLVSQSPIGLAVLDTDLRYVSVNPALERINGVSAAEHVGRHVRDALPFLDTEAIESAMRQVLETGTPILDQNAVGRTPVDPDHDHAWSVSYYRLEDPGGKVLGVATSFMDLTGRHRATIAAAQARQSLALIADASMRIGTTLDLDETARELAQVCVPSLADVATVDILDDALHGTSAAAPPQGPALFRALAVKAAYPAETARATDPPGSPARYEADRLVTQCVTSGRPVLVPHVDADDLPRIARSPDTATLWDRAGLHSYLAVPLIARGEVLGALDLKRTRNPQPFTTDDALLAGELAARAAVCIDNARWYQSQRHASLTLQRSLLPEQPQHPPGLEIAYRYQPAGIASEIGGDWFDVIPLTGGKTGLVVGDVMGSGISAASTMGQLRTATRAFADLDLDPAQLLRHLDNITCGLDQPLTTCVYVVYDPHHGHCHISLAGHLPPAVVRPGRPAELLDLPTGAPLGISEVPFTTTTLRLHPGDRLVLYTDGLVETRDQAIDQRLNTLLRLLSGPHRPLEETCDRLLHALRYPNHHDDVALLIAQPQHMTRPPPPTSRRGRDNA
ncbi:SpoIIE family protein phosphatase [Streptomyces sp. NPDC020096]